MWDWAAEKQVARVSDEKEIWDVAFSPDGKYLALAGMDGTAVLWEIASESISAEMLHEAPVATLNFSPDSEYLATASSDGTARVQPWQSEWLMDVACKRLTRNLTE